MAHDAAVVDVVAKYFFFTCLDERQTMRASFKTLSELKNKNWLDFEHRARWIQTMHKFKGKVSAPSGRLSQLGSGFSLPAELDLNAWLSFMSSVDLREVEAVLLSRMLGFTDEEIAAGLSVSLGTVRYRVGRGLRHLGGFIEP